MASETTYTYTTICISTILSIFLGMGGGFRCAPYVIIPDMGAYPGYKLHIEAALVHQYYG